MAETNLKNTRNYTYDKFINRFFGTNCAEHDVSQINEFCNYNLLKFFINYKFYGKNKAVNLKKNLY